MNKVVPERQANYVDKMRWFYFHWKYSWILSYWSWGELKKNYDAGAKFVLKSSSNINTIFVNKRNQR